MLKLSILVLLLLSSSAIACTVPPSHWGASPYGMVIATPTIVLAKATQIVQDGQFSVAHFETIEAVRGTPPSSFTLRGWFAVRDLRDFSGHKDPQFWVHNFGSAVAPGDCKAYGVFEAGETYLIFLDGPNYPRSFENIKSTDDLWYQTVLNALKTPNEVLEVQ